MVVDSGSFNRGVYPIILAGGSGTRLWPLSRESRPKQFVDILDGLNLLNEALLRTRDSQKINFHAPTVITNEDYRFMVKEKLDEIGEKAGKIILEPKKLNTAPAVLAACSVISKTDPNAIILVLPSDHLIKPKITFLEAVEDALPIVVDEGIVTFGVEPTRIATSYGYLKLGEKITRNANRLISFVEKPTQEKAKQMLDSGGYQWNSGMLCAQVKTLMESAKNHCPDILENVEAAVDRAELDLGFIRLHSESYQKCREISIDYALLEKEQDLFSVNLSAEWYDLGDWETIWRYSDTDENQFSSTGNVYGFDCKQTLLRSDVENQILVGAGLEDIIAVVTPDAVLVCKKSETQQLKNIISELHEKDVKQIVQASVDYRPWGKYEIISNGDRYQVKKITVNSGAALSLQSHIHRSEHWIIVQGTALVQIGDEKKMVTEGESVYIPLGAKHRLENPGKVPLTLIEVQTGTYLAEDDIIRYEDIYNRNSN